MEVSALPKFLKASSVFALATGCMDIVAGVDSLKTITGVPLPIDSPAAIFADSQIRFLGGIWAGYGVMLWWASNDLHSRRVPLRILGYTVVLSGIGRAISGAVHGFSSNLILTFAVIELLVPPAIWAFAP